MNRVACQSMGLDTRRVDRRPRPAVLLIFEVAMRCIGKEEVPQAAAEGVTAWWPVSGTCLMSLMRLEDLARGCSTGFSGPSSRLGTPPGCQPCPTLCSLDHHLEFLAAQPFLSYADTVVSRRKQDGLRAQGPMASNSLDEAELLQLAPQALLAVARVATEIGAKRRDRHFGTLGAELAVLSQDLETYDSPLQKEKIRSRIRKLLVAVERACAVRSSVLPSLMRLLC